MAEKALTGGEPVGPTTIELAVLAVSLPGRLPLLLFGSLFRPFPSRGGMQQSAACLVRTQSPDPEGVRDRTNMGHFGAAVLVGEIL